MGVNKVKRDSLASRTRTSTTGRRNARNDKQIQPTGATHIVFAVDSPIILRTIANTKILNVIDATKKGICGPSVATRSHHAQKLKGRQHVRFADQDAAEEAPVGGEDQFFESIFNLDGAQSSVSQNSGMATTAVKVPVLIEDTEFLMEVDTGAAASILSYSDYERNFKYLALRPVKRSFHAYAGTPLDVAGQILVDIQHNGQRATLPLLVVRA